MWYMSLKCLGYSSMYPTYANKKDVLVKSVVFAKLQQNLIYIKLSR